MMRFVLLRAGMKTTMAIALAVALAVVSTGVSAQNALSDLDANGDGTIGRQEAMSAQVESFHQIDDNGDDHLSVDELEASQAAPESDRIPPDVRRARAKARERWLANLDRDDSGGVSLDEYQAAMTPYFDRLDADGNGALDAAELRKAIEPNEDG